MPERVCLVTGGSAGIGEAVCRRLLAEEARVINFDIQPPGALTQSLVIGGTYLPLYRLFMIVGALVIGIVLWLAMAIVE